MQTNYTKNGNIRNVFLMNNGVEIGYFSVKCDKLGEDCDMNISIDEYNTMKQEIDELKKKNEELESRLKTYTSNHRHKKYYDNNTEIVKQRAKNYMEKVKETNPEKLKEWRHTAYLKRKEKLKLQEEGTN